MSMGMESAAGGIRAALANMAVRSQNVANVNTPKYRSKEVVQTENASGGVSVEAIREKRPESPEIRDSLEVSSTLEQIQEKKREEAEKQVETENRRAVHDATQPIPDAFSLRVEEDGKVYAVRPDEERVQVGKLFQSGLRAGAVDEKNPIPSDVDLAEEMTGMILDEKALKANVEAIRTKDQMLGDILDLKG